MDNSPVAEMLSAMGACCVRRQALVRRFRQECQLADDLAVVGGIDNVRVNPATIVEGVYRLRHLMMSFR